MRPAKPLAVVLTLSLLSFAAAAGAQIDSVEVNPFLVLPEGEGGYAVDALIVPTPTAESGCGASG